MTDVWSGTLPYGNPCCLPEIYCSCYQCCQLAFFNARFHKFGLFENDLALKIFKILIYCLALGILKFIKQNHKSGIICAGIWHFVITKTWQHWLHPKIGPRKKMKEKKFATRANFEMGIHFFFFSNWCYMQDFYFPR